MKGKLSKIIKFLMIFLLCVNIYSFMLMHLNNTKSMIYVDQSQSFLNTNQGSDPMTLKFGTFYGPNTLEPVESWDSSSNDVIKQVVETLFTYDLNNPDLPLINQLFNFHSIPASRGISPASP